MKNRLLKKGLIDEFIEKLSVSVYNLKKENADYCSWDLFFDELFMGDNTVETGNTGAIALGIITLCNSGKKTEDYQSTIRRSVALLKHLRNADGSWPVSGSINGELKSGAVYNTVIAIQSLLSAGFLDINETDPALLNDNLKFILESFEWVYAQRIIKTESDKEYYGWGYTGESHKKIYMMPTIHVLLAMKKTYYKLATSWKQSLDHNLVGGKTILQIIDEIQDSVYHFRISPEEGWGKDISENKSRIIYTLYGLYGLSYMGAEKNDGTKYPKNPLSADDVELFTDMICNWKKIFEKTDDLDPEEYFDSYIQENLAASNEIIDHETFFEAIAITSIIGLIKRYKGTIKKRKHKTLYQIITNLSNSLKSRICLVSIYDKTYTLIRSRRGLLSQSYPIYAVAQTTDALLMIKEERECIRSLMDHQGLLLKIVGVILQVLTLFVINCVAMRGVPVAILAGVSLFAPLSEYLKNWIFKYSKMNE